MALAVGIVAFCLLTAPLTDGLTQPGLGSPEALVSLGVIALIFVGPSIIGGWLGVRLRTRLGWDE